MLLHGIAKEAKEGETTLGQLQNVAEQRPLSGLNHVQYGYATEIRVFSLEKKGEVEMNLYAIFL